MTGSSRLPDGTCLFLGDGGLETTMIFERGLDLPCFAAFTGICERWLADAGTDR